MLTGARQRVEDPSDGVAVNGYSLLPGFLNGEVIAALRDAVDRALQAPPVAGCERPHNRLVPLRWNDPVVGLVLDDTRRRDAIRTVTGGYDVRFISAYITVKEARTPALWWHQDWWCWDHPVSLRSSAPQVALLCYLSDTNARNGALRVLPGSHRASVPLHAALRDAHREGEGLPLDDAVFGDQPGQLTLGAGAGDAVVLDYRLLHGTHPNRSASRRDCVLLSFAPCWRGLPTDIRAHLIRHLALPRDDEPATQTGCPAELLPRFDGSRADLELNRVAPATFSVAG